LIVGEKSDNKNLRYPETSRLANIVQTRDNQIGMIVSELMLLSIEPLLHDPATGDLLLNYLQDDKRLAEEIISGDIIARISAEFP
jgi:hypothetical protein